MGISINNHCVDCEHYEEKAETCEPMRELLDSLPTGKVPSFAEIVFKGDHIGCDQWSPSEDYLSQLADDDSYRDATRPGINVPFREVA